ncbi:MAG: hypothetical protein H6724_07850 [Sandaracinus sp.]|nr:hypothetical protein [Myxococcales bacterium]MCB9603503.1 hypothetical protein [Sandaracinus sp.]MCB9619350.1 hypothetical protein [Sandaracinus sp.]
MRALLVLLLVGCSGAPPVQSDPPGPSVELVVVNATDQTVHLVNTVSCGFDALDVVAPDGRPMRRNAGQSHSCEWTRGTDPCPVAGACMNPPTQALEPGQRWSTTWDGRAVETRHQEATAPGCPSDCSVWVRVADGAYRVRARAHTGCEGECTGEPGLEVTGTVRVGSDRQLELTLR